MRIAGFAIFAACIGFEIVVNLFLARVARMYSVGLVVIAIGLLGLVQGVTGVSIPALAVGWSSLRPWQRGVISALVIVGALAAGGLAIWIASLP